MLRHAVAAHAWPQELHEHPSLQTLHKVETMLRCLKRSTIHLQMYGAQSQQHRKVQQTQSGVAVGSTTGALGMPDGRIPALHVRCRVLAHEFTQNSIK